jgi:hypothetical protein
MTMGMVPVARFAAHDGRPQRDDHVYVARDQFGGKHREAVQLSVGPAIGDRETLSLDAAEFAKLATELVNERIRGRGVVENADMRPSLHASGLLRACRKRPRRRATE